MAPPGQRTFVPVPTTVGIQSLIARPEGEAVVSHRPMTSRDVREAYRKRTGAGAKAPPTDEELRRQRLVAATDKKERDKEKNLAKARAAREKKAERERAEREEKKRLGLPVVGVTASQATIAGFFRGGGMERRREVGGVELVKPLGVVEEDKDKENQDLEAQQPPAKKQKVEEGERKPMQRAPPKKKIFGRNLPFKGQAGAVRTVDHKHERPSHSPSKKKPTELVEYADEKQPSSRLPAPKLDTDSAGSQAKERPRSTPAKETPRHRASEPKAEHARPVPKMYKDTRRLDDKESVGNTGSEARLTPAREAIPSINKTSATTRPVSEPDAFTKPTPIAKLPQVPTVSLARMPPPERMRSEPVHVANPPSHRRSSPPLHKRERGLSEPHPNPAAHATGPEPRNLQGLVTPATYTKPLPKTDRPTVPPAIPPTKVTSTSPGSCPKPRGPGLLGYPSVEAQTRARSPQMPPVSRPLIIPSKQQVPVGLGRPSVGAAAFAQPPQKPPAKPPTTLPAVPPQRHLVAYPKHSAYSRAPPITAASLGYLPPAEPRGPPKPAALAPAFVRPNRPQHSPIMPGFKSNNVSTGPAGFKTPKFLPTNGGPSTPTNTGMHTAGPGAGAGPPLSTQRFLEMHFDSVLPSPSQVERELQECSAAPPSRPAFINPRPVVTPHAQPPRFMAKPPVPRFNTTPSPRPNPIPRQSVNPIRLQAVQAMQEMEDSLPFLSTQDFAFSSQDIRELEDSDTPGKPPPTLRTKPRPSRLGNHIIPSVTEASPLPRVLSSAVKSPTGNVTPQPTPIQRANPLSSIMQVGLPAHALSSVGQGLGMKGLPQPGPPQQTVVQAANPPAGRGNPTLSPFGSCSDRPQFFDTQASVDPQEFMNLVAENIRVCHGIAEERQRQEDNGESGGGNQGAGALLSQETDYSDLDLGSDDLIGF